MEGADDAGELEYPKTLAALAAFMDGLSPRLDVAVQWRLGHARRAAEAANDAPLVDATNAEGNAYLFFGDTGSVAGAVAQIHNYFNEQMIDYLRQRRETTPQRAYRPDTPTSSLLI